MASWKARKGNPFERRVLFNLQKIGFKAEILNDNTAGIDIIAKDPRQPTEPPLAIECKFHKGFSWNELEKIFLKTEHKAIGQGLAPLFIFKSNRQPACVFYRSIIGLQIMKFEDYFNTPFSETPKGFKIWQQHKEI